VVASVDAHSVRPRDPVYARFASFDGLKSAEARSAKAESGDPECQLKKWNRAWKLELIERGNPAWRDLASDLTP
jgi:predicted GIY-YIG superfamily endonuclease